MLFDKSHLRMKNIDITEPRYWELSRLGKCDEKSQGGKANLEGIFGIHQTEVRRNILIGWTLDTN